MGLRCLVIGFVVALMAALAVGQALPAQGDLRRADLQRLRPEQRERLESRIGLTVREVVERDGRAVGLGGYRGKVIVLQAWSGRDATSRRLIDLVGAALEPVGEGAVFVALHLGEPTARGTDVGPFGAVTVESMVDGAAAFVDALGLPERGGNLVVDRRGTVRYAGVGPRNLTELVEGLAAEEVASGFAEATVLALAKEEAAAEAMRERVDAAFASGDAAAIEAAMVEMWTAAPSASYDATVSLLTGRNASMTPLAVELLGRYASAEQVFDALNALNRRQVEERRYLVRSLGSKSMEDPGAVVGPYLDDVEYDVRIAAALALGEIGDPETLPLLTQGLRRPPVLASDWENEDLERETMARQAACRQITGLRTGERDDFEAWYRLWQSDEGAARRMSEQSRENTGADAERFQAFGDTWRPFENFDLAVRINGRGDDLPAGGSQEFIRLITQGRDRAISGASGVLGRYEPPVIRVTLASDLQFQAFGTSAGFSGLAFGNRLVLLLADPIAMQRVAVHEWVHIIHQASFGEQPRWASEGFADSVSSGEPAPWTFGDIADRNLQDFLDRGVYSVARSWDGPQGEEEEAKHYANSRLLVDYLRSGPFTAAETRLAFLFGRLGRGLSEQQALTELYGMNGRQIDESIRAWVSGAGQGR